MSSNKKIALTSGVLILLIIITTVSIIAVFAATQHTVSTEVSVTYRSEYVSGTASAKYYVGNADKVGVEMRENGEETGETIIKFNSRETAKATSLSPVENEIKLSEDDNFVVFEYYFTNSNVQNDYAAQLTTVESNVKNMKITTALSDEPITSYNSIKDKVEDISNLNTTKIIKANYHGYVYVKVAIDNLDNNADFVIEFSWNLGKLQPSMDRLELSQQESHYVVTQKDSSANGDVIIPSEYGGIPVTEIGEDAFRGSTDISMVVIPNSVETIANSAFYQCSGLKDVKFGNGVKTIGNYAFANCTNLTSLTIPNGATTIGDYAFMYCPEITSIHLPGSLTSIGQDAFLDCKKVNSIVVDEGEGVFTSRDNSGNEMNVLIDSSTGTLVKGSNSGEIPTDGSVTIIGAHAFDGSTIGGDLVIPDCIKEIQYNAFEDCSQLTSVTIGSGVTDIGFYAFTGCSKLKTVNFGENVKTIGQSAFRGLSRLTSLTLPQNLVSIGAYAFNTCSGLKGELIIPDSVQTLESYSFYGCKNLSSVKIGDGLKTIGSNSFVYCTGLQEVDIGASVTNISSNSFAGCSNLKKVILGENVKTIGPMAFQQCNSLNEIVINGENGYKLIGKSTSSNGYLDNYITQGGIIKVLNTIDASTNSYVLENYTLSDTEGDYNVYTKN